MGSKGAKDINGRAMAAVDDVTERGAAYLSDAAAQGQRLARDVDERLEEYTGKSSDAWIKDATRMMKQHPWKSLAVVGLVAYVLGKLRG
jgi:ElaB/YqjD/DUF883 family membrane-anchored ribosome-binding protein